MFEATNLPAACKYYSRLPTETQKYKLFCIKFKAFCCIHMGPGSQRERRSDCFHDHSRQRRRKTLENISGVDRCGQLPVLKTLNLKHCQASVRHMTSCSFVAHNSTHDCFHAPDLPPDCWQDLTHSHPGAYITTHFCAQDLTVPCLKRGRATEWRWTDYFGRGESDPYMVNA